MTDLKTEGGETQNKTSDDSKGFCNVGHCFKHEYHLFNIICTRKKNSDISKAVSKLGLQH